MAALNPLTVHIPVGIHFRARRSVHWGNWVIKRINSQDWAERALGRTLTGLIVTPITLSVPSGGWPLPEASSSGQFALKHKQARRCGTDAHLPTFPPAPPDIPTAPL